ncbi:hypothetical protein ACFX2J_019725 [Malus domestica]
MEETQSQSNNYRFSSSSASSPASRVPSSNFFYLRKTGSLRQPISFEDSPEWDDIDIDLQLRKRKYSEKVMKSSNGYTLPGTITVIMGPAKSGKSTLLRALAGRLPYSAIMYDEVFVNGSKSPMPYGSYLGSCFSLQSALPITLRSHPRRGARAPLPPPVGFSADPFRLRCQRCTSRPDFLLQTLSRC